MVKSSDGQQNSTAILGSTLSLSDTAESDVRRVKKERNYKTLALFVVKTLFWKEEPTNGEVLIFFMYRRPTLYPLEIAVDFLKSL